MVGGLSLAVCVVSDCTLWFSEWVLWLWIDFDGVVLSLPGNGTVLSTLLDSNSRNFATIFLVKAGGGNSSSRTKTVLEPCTSSCSESISDWWWCNDVPALPSHLDGFFCIDTCCWSAAAFCERLSNILRMSFNGTDGICQMSTQSSENHCTIKGGGASARLIAPPCAETAWMGPMHCPGGPGESVELMCARFV